MPPHVIPVKTGIRVFQKTTFLDPGFHRDDEKEENTDNEASFLIKFHERKDVSSNHKLKNGGVT